MGYRGGNPDLEFGGLHLLCAVLRAGLVLSEGMGDTTWRNHTEECGKQLSPVCCGVGRTEILGEVEC